MLFELNDIECAYGPDKPVVLRVDRFVIPRGELTVLLGVSGAGKSTMLETLALMNDTLRSGSIRLYPEAEGSPVEYAALWGKQQAGERAALRTRHFSFIFQSTNLMENFTVLQNIALAQMLQGYTEQQAVERSARYLQALGLMDADRSRKRDVIEPHTLPMHLSGGQRQRVAFVRAISSDFTVLFADEPTGNLDEVNAEEVMRRLREALQERGASAIVVSHGIDLSMQFADRIVIMTKHETTDKAGNALACGLISAENTYHRHGDGWRKESDSSVLSGTEFRQIIKNHFDSNMRYEQAGNTHA